MDGLVKRSELGSVVRLWLRLFQNIVDHNLCIIVGWLRKEDGKLAVSLKLFHTTFSNGGNGGVQGIGSG